MAADKEIISTILLGTTIMLAVSVTTIYFVARHRKRYLIQQHELQRLESEKKEEVLRAIIRTQEEERSRIATNLHDSIGAELSMLKLNLTKHAYFSKDGNFDMADFNMNIERLDSTIDSLRSACRDLYPVTLQNYGFIYTFEELIHRLNTAGHIVCKYKVNFLEKDIFQDLDSKLNLLRIFQEVINNLVKYAACTFLDIGLMIAGNEIKIILKHNGAGFSNADVQKLLSESKGVGLFSIKNRIEVMHGKIDYFRVSNGSEIIIELPLAHVR